MGSYGDRHCDYARPCFARRVPPHDSYGCLLRPSFVPSIVRFSQTYSGVGTDMNDTCVLFEETVQPGASWSHVLKRGTALRITDLEGGANAGALFYNFECPVERYNMPDTLKAQHTARLTKGFVLYSDMGRILCSIVDDTVGWHDPLGGCSNAEMLGARYGEARYQEHRNEYHKNGRDSFLIELGKWGLGPKDLTSNVNFFSRVDVGTDGAMSFVS